MKFIIFADGGSRGNPGPSAIGVVIDDAKGRVIFSAGKCIGKATNNQAEYQAVIFALEKAKKLGAAELDFYLDSELLVKQLNGEYKVKNAELAQLYLKIWNLQSQFKKVVYRHIPREKNIEADKFVNEALDRAKG